jgi:2-dehydro-3-deoxyphosphooctonate aldolase (KDO 8-P synthase)
MAAAYVDVLQIPAFLVRQTDLVVAAAKTGKVVNLKKGQFMSPEAMGHAVQKVKDTGSDKAWITDRGTMFGYQDMVVDFRGIPTMKQFAPVILDVTHSLQQPNQSTGVTGGRPEMISTIARAGIATGADGLFIETHFDPANAKSDGANMLDIANLEKLLTDLVAIRKTVNTL